VLKGLSPIGLDLAVIGMFTLLNTLNMRIGSKIQMAFVLMKNIPILFIILSGLIYFDLVNIDTAINLSAIPFSVPLIIYAFAGFEASCSLSAHIENSEKNAPKALLISFFLVCFIYAAYQLMFYGIIGSELGNLNHYFEIFPALISKVMPHGGPIALKIQAILQLAIALSSLGSGYGVLFSNSWNLYAVAQHNHLPGSSFISKLNQHGVAQACLIIEAFIAVAYILITWGHNVPLQQIGAFCSVLAYTISAMALWANAYRQNLRSRLAIATLAVASCLMLTVACLNGFMKDSTYAPGLFFGLLMLGVMLFYWQKRQTTLLTR
jgi:amino acid transporter